jgi:hypothetical protein
VARTVPGDPRDRRALRRDADGTGARHLDRPRVRPSHRRPRRGRRRPVLLRLAPIRGIVLAAGRLDRPELAHPPAALSRGQGVRHRRTGRLAVVVYGGVAIGLFAARRRVRGHDPRRLGVAPRCSGAPTSRYAPGLHQPPGGDGARRPRRLDHRSSGRGWPTRSPCGATCGGSCSGSCSYSWPRPEGWSGNA